MVDLVVPLVVDVGRKIDYDDERRNTVMESMDLMGDNQDLLGMIDNSF
jgi:hypothetical protein